MDSSRDRADRSHLGSTPVMTRAMIALSRTNYSVLTWDRRDEWIEAWPGEVELLDRSRLESRARAKPAWFAMRDGTTSS